MIEQAGGLTLQPGDGGGGGGGGGGQGRQSLRAKAEIADYVLVYRNTLLAVIEAKAWDKPLTEGVGQAMRYAAKLALRSAFATNGQAIYGIDMDTGVEADVARYPSPEVLWTLTNAQPNAWRDRFAAVPFEDKGGTCLEAHGPNARFERDRMDRAGHPPKVATATRRRNRQARCSPRAPGRHRGARARAWLILR